MRLGEKTEKQGTNRWPNESVDQGLVKALIRTFAVKRKSVCKEKYVLVLRINLRAQNEERNIECVL